MVDECNGLIVNTPQNGSTGLQLLSSGFVIFSAFLADARSWLELEYSSASVVPAIKGHTAQVSLLIEDQPCRGKVPIGAVGLRTEAVEDCLLAFGSDLEYDATSTTVAVVASALRGCPIQVSLLIED